MADKEIDKRHQILRANLVETQVRIRRYTLDDRLKQREGTADDDLRNRAEQAWKDWLAVWGQLTTLPDGPTSAQLHPIEEAWLKLDHEMDLIQRDLISGQSFKAGVWTAIGLAIATALLVVFYLGTHGMQGVDFSRFEPWPEWGPLKYAEVACWSLFGVLCYLLFTATYYLARRDFDVWYWPWYISTALRGVFFSVILMILVLEFVEWYGEGKWIQTYLLEEGNKYYFIVFLSFCLGLASHSTAAIMRDLSDGVTEFVSRVVGRVSQRLSLAVTKADAGGK